VALVVVLVVVELSVSVVVVEVIVTGDGGAVVDRDVVVVDVVVTEVLLLLLALLLLGVVGEVVGVVVGLVVVVAAVVVLVTVLVVVVVSGLVVVVILVVVVVAVLMSSAVFAAGELSLSRRCLATDDVTAGDASDVSSRDDDVIGCRVADVALLGVTSTHVSVAVVTFSCNVLSDVTSGWQCLVTLAIVNDDVRASRDSPNHVTSSVASNSSSSVVLKHKQEAPLSLTTDASVAQFSCEQRSFSWYLPSASAICTILYLTNMKLLTL